MRRLLLTHSCWSKSYNFGEVIVEFSLSSICGFQELKFAPAESGATTAQASGGRGHFCLKSSLKMKFKIHGCTNCKNGPKYPILAHVPAFSLGIMGDRDESTSQPQPLASRKNRCADNGLAHFGTRPLSCPLNLTPKTAYFDGFTAIQIFQNLSLFHPNH